MESQGRETEVTEKARRRKFSAAEKARILLEYAQCTQSGEVGALLRREGIYSSHVAKWREQAQAAERAALEPKKRGPKPDLAAGHVRRISDLERRNAHLEKRLGQAEAIIAIQKKLASLLGIELPAEPVVK